MADILSDEEFIEAMDLVETISHAKVSEELDRLAEREKSLILNNSLDPDARNIMLYNFSILVAASARMKLMSMALDPPSESSQK